MTDDSKIFGLRKEKFGDVAAFLNGYHKQVTVLFFLALAAIGFFVRDDYDMYFLVENGKQILENGFPYYDWMSMHENYAIILQQWPVSIIDYLVTSKLGNTGMILSVGLLNMLIYFVVYKCALSKSNHNYTVAYAVTAVTAITITLAISNGRPSLWSVLFVALALLVTEYYHKTNKQWLLALLPIISVLSCNFHSTFWIAVIGTIIVELAAEIWHRQREGYLTSKQSLTLVMVMIICLATCFVNPYGPQAVLHGLVTIGHSEEYSYVQELQGIVGMRSLVYFVIPLAFLLYQAGKKRLETIDYGTMFLYAVTCVATIMAVRSMLFNILLWGQVVAALYGKTTPRELKISFGFKEKLASAGVTLIIVSVVFTNIVNYTSEYHSEENWGELDQLVSLLQEETSGADTSKLTVFPSDISQGQYLYHFVGLRPYIDGRLETYVSDCNGQEDIFAEYLGAIKQGNLYNVVDKYKFDYVVLDGPYSYSLPSGYSLVGSTYDDGDESFYYLYRYDG